MEEKKVRKITLGFVLGWIFGVIFLLAWVIFLWAGFISIFSKDFSVGIFRMLMSFILLLLANKLLANKLKFVLSGGLKFVLILVLFVLIGIGARNRAKEGGFAITEDNVVKEAFKTAAGGEENASRSASSYLSLAPFSYTGLIEQLEYEGYTKEEAVYAVDNCGADWNEQAAKSARNYMETSALSRTELINQLKYEGFTEEQAEYGAKAVGY